MSLPLPAMSRPLLACLAALCLLTAAPARAQVDAAVRHFDDGARRYADGDYRGALTAYEQALATGFASGALYYNMGNAYFRLDEVGQAIRHYEKARAFLPDSPELGHNLEIARARAVDRMSTLPEPFWRPWWRRLLALTGVGGLFFAGLALYLAAAALLGHRIWTGTRLPWHRRTLAATSAAGLLLLVLAFTASLDRQHHRRAVVIATAVGLHEAPQAQTDVALELHEGLLLDILDERDAWLEVRLPNGTTGWIDAQAVGEI